MPMDALHGGTMTVEGEVQSTGGTEEGHKDDLRERGCETRPDAAEA